MAELQAHITAVAALEGISDGSLDLYDIEEEWFPRPLSQIYSAIDGRPLVKKPVFKNREEKGIMYENVPRERSSILQGAPPPNSKYQCKAAKSGTNPPVRCKKWRLKGSEYCQWHGGRSRRGQGTKPKTNDTLGIYSRNVGPLLREKLEEMAKLSPEHRHSLAEEIDISRVLAEKALKAYDVITNTEQGRKASPEVKAMVEQQLRKALEFVSRITHTAAKVKAVHQSTVDIEQLDYIVRQVTIIIEEEIADYDREMADRVVERLRDIKLPTREGQGSMSPQELAAALREGSEAIMRGILADPPSAESDPPSAESDPPSAESDPPSAESD